MTILFANHITIQKWIKSVLLDNIPHKDTGVEFLDPHGKRLQVCIWSRTSTQGHPIKM